MSPFDPAWAADPAPEGGVFTDAVWVAALLAIDPIGLGGMTIRAWSGPARENYLQNYRGLLPAKSSFRRMPLHISDQQILGGLDLPATLATGRAVMTSGLLGDCDGGVLVVAMAERIGTGTAARLAAVMDRHAVITEQNSITTIHPARLAVVALDEGHEPDEAPPACLLERLAFTVAQSGLSGDAVWPDAAMVAQARESLGMIASSDDALAQLCSLAAALGIGSLRAPLFALRAARAAAALQGREAVAACDIALAARLVLAPRATQVPSAPADEKPEDQAEESAESQSPRDDQPEAVEDSISDAQKSVLPPELLAALAAGAGPKRASRGAGKTGDSTSLRRGRPAGTKRGALGGGARLNLIETLRAAAPWQRLRQTAVPGCKLQIRADDFRIQKFKEQTKSVAIFAVDASGSAAVNRLAEAKGAVQLLLADCYVRRDQVALLAFRGRVAECLLPPTSALARAKRSLAGLPGGGPTPLATGINAAREMAEAERRKGHQPLLVLLTDGGANIGRDGKPGRAAAAHDALAAARLCRGARLSCLVVDTAPRPQPFVAKLAGEMAARYVPLPYADPSHLSRIVQSQGDFRASSAA
jgi:magnesium chelatase subunit D